MKTGGRRITTFATAAGLAIVMLLTGCASDPLAEQYRDGGNENYIAGDGAVLEIPESRRAAPVEFEGTTDAGGKVSSSDYAGDVLVVNFWASYCGPCRLEAPDLQALSESYREKGVSFLGVNIAEQPGTSLAFSRKYGVTYPSIIDADTGAVRLAFAGNTGQGALPTTLVLDKQGRVAARILGQVQARSILESLLKTALAEDE